MKINYCLERKDIFAFQVYALLKNKILRLVLAVTVLLQSYTSFAGPIKWVLFGDGLSESASGYLLQVFARAATEFAIGLVVIGAVIVVVNVVTLVFLALKFKDGDGSLGEHQIVLNEASLMEITDVNETSHGWKSVQKIVEWTRYVLIYVSPTHAHIIPKRSFATEHELAAFVDEAKRLRENAQTSFSPSYLAANS